MRRTIAGTLTLACILISCLTAEAQKVKISGAILNKNSREGIPAVSITIKESGAIHFSNSRGEFSIIHVGSLPVTLVITSVGYEPYETIVSSVSEGLAIELVVARSLGQEVVVSASRVPEKILSSPVTIERVGAAQIRNAPASSYYDIVSNLKGVDFTTSSLTWRTMTTRGFGGSGNVRFNQLVDGMDNQAPGLNFSVASIVGLSELDVDNMELLSGASSALYGPGGMNGTLLISSKSPFKYTGLSFQVKQGVMHTDKSERPTSPYYNWTMRWAEKVSNRFAFKLNAEMIQAKDWIGMDYRDYNRSTGNLVAGNRNTDPNYDGVNVYGDETSGDLRLVLNSIAAQLPFMAQYISTLTQNPILVSRTGYTEQELMDPNTVNFKLGGSLNFKVTENLEAILAGYWGTGNTVYTGASRYSIKDFKMGQYKFELKNKNGYFRFYTTQENAGESYNLAATTQNFNEVWKPSGGSTGWYSQYGQAYLAGKLNGLSDIDAHNAARLVADVGRPAVGSAEFNSIYNSVRKLPVPQGGLLLDRSDLYGSEISYNLSEYTEKFADVIVGGNWRQYVLNSQGTLFADTSDPIQMNEYGIFLQAGRNVMEKLRMTASFRMDKNQYFDARVTPRLTAVYSVDPKNNIRFSYQTAYRFPSTQMQFINLDLVTYKLIGGNMMFDQIYNFSNNPIYYRDALQNGVIEKFDFKGLKPESLSSFELGYKGLLLDGKMLVDMYGYYGKYTNFLSRQIVVQSRTGSPITLADTINGQVYSVPVNAAGEIPTYGFGVSAEYQLPRNFYISANMASDNLGSVDEDLIVFFNSPKYKFNGTISNTGFGKGNRFGFNLTYRWQAGFYFEGDLANGNVPAVNILDAMVSYKLPVKRCLLKIGANNLLNQYYYNAIGNSRVGGLYYVSFGYNVY